MTRCYYKNEIIDNKNDYIQTIHFYKQQLLGTYVNNHNMSSIYNLTKKQKHEIFFLKKIVKRIHHFLT